jgi:hypothetical protein
MSRHFDEIQAHFRALTDMLQFLTLEEQVSCLESIVDVRMDLASLTERAISLTQSGCVRHIDNLKSSKEILDLLDLNNRVVEAAKYCDRLMSTCDLIVKVLDVHTVTCNVDVLCFTLSVLEKQAAGAAVAAVDFKKTQDAVVAVIDKFAAADLYGDDIIKQAIRTLKAGRNYSLDRNILKSLFSALALVDTRSMFLEVINLINESLVTSILNLHCDDEWPSRIINGFDKYGGNSEILMAGCEFIKRFQSFQNLNQLFLINVILSLLPHRAVYPSIVETAANTISVACTHFSKNSLPALKQLLIPCSDYGLIFQAIVDTIQSSSNIRSILPYCLPEIVKSYCYFGSLGFHYSSAGMHKILVRAGYVEFRKVYEVIFQSVVWHANLDAVTNYIYVCNIL